MPQNVPGTPGRFTRKCQPMPMSHSYQRWGGRFFSRNCFNHRPIREPVVLIRVAIATSTSVHCPFFGLVEHHGGEVQSGPLRRLLRRSDRSAIGGKPGFCANSGSGWTAASVGGQSEACPRADLHFALTLTWARRGACHRAALCAVPLAPLPTYACSAAARLTHSTREQKSGSVFFIFHQRSGCAILSLIR
jgi:hypothetical protein